MDDIKNKQSNPVEGHGYFPNTDYSGKHFFPNSIYSKPKHKKNGKTIKKTKKAVLKRKNTTKKIKIVKTTRKPIVKPVKKSKPVVKTSKPITKVEKKPIVKVENKQEAKKPVVSEAKRFEAAKPIPPNTTNSKTKKGRIALGIVFGVVLPILLIIALLLFLARCSTKEETTLDIRTSEDGTTVCYGFKETATTEQILKEFETNLVIPAIVNVINADAFVKENQSTIPAEIIKLSFEDNSNCYTIDTNSFMHAPIQEVDFPSQLITIGSQAFNDSAITKVKLPLSLEQDGSLIGEGAFTQCESLSEIDFSEWNEFKVDTIAEHAFEPVSTRGTVKINSEIFETDKEFYWNWKAYLINYQGFTNETFAKDKWMINPYPPKDVLKIENGELKGFRDHANSDEIHDVLNGVLKITNGFRTIDVNAFYDGNKSTIPTDIILSFEDRTENLLIGPHAFQNYQYTEGTLEFNFSSVIEEIQESAFDSSNIEILKLDPSTSLHTKAFANISNLHEIDLTAFTTIPTLDTWKANDIFAGENSQGSGVIKVKTEESIPSWISYLHDTQSFDFTEGHWRIEAVELDTVLDIRDNVLYGFIEGTTPDQIQEEFGDNIKIPEEVTEVANEAFMNDGSSTEKVIIPEFIKSITFAEPGNIEKIGDKAFAFNPNITQININELSGLTSLGDYAFVACSGLNKFDSQGQSNILSLCDNMDKIGICAFDGCSNIEGIKLPVITNETEVGKFAFATGGNKLNNINFSNLEIVVNGTGTDYESCSMKTWMDKANQGLFVDVAANGSIKLPQYSGILSPEKAFLLADSMLEAIQTQNNSAFYWLFSKLTIEEGINLLSWTLLPN